MPLTLWSSQSGEKKVFNTRKKWQKEILLQRMFDCCQTTHTISQVCRTLPKNECSGKYTLSVIFLLFHPYPGWKFLRDGIKLMPLQYDIKTACLNHRAGMNKNKKLFFSFFYKVDLQKHNCVKIKIRNEWDSILWATFQTTVKYCFYH